MTILAIIAVISASAAALFALLGFLKISRSSLLSEKMISLESSFQKMQVDLVQRFTESTGNSVLKTQEKLAQELNLVRDVLSRETTANRATLEAALAAGRAESRAILTEVAQGLEGKFILLQKSTEDKLESIRGEVDKKLSETVAKNFESFGAVSKRLEELQSVTGQVIHLSQGVRDLSRILDSPKLRGEMGEFQLGEMLRQVLSGECFEEQFAIDGSAKERVDAVIKLREGFLCIDSKFPLDNARKLFEDDLSEDQRKLITKLFAGDVKVMADSIAEKYIIPDKTLDFALMFVPAEMVFHELLRNNELHNYCLKKHVIPVSPNSFYAYLQAIAVGFRGLKIQAEAKKIEAVLARLKKDFDRLGSDFVKVGKHLKDASTQYTNVEDRVSKIGRVIERLGIEHQEAPEELEPGESSTSPTIEPL